METNGLMGSGGGGRPNSMQGARTKRLWLWARAKPRVRVNLREYLMRGCNDFREGAETPHRESKYSLKD